MRSRAGSTVRNRLFTSLLVLFVTATAGAWDFGGFVDTTSGIESAPGAAADATGSDARDLIQRSGLGVWLYHGMGNWTLDAQASAYLELSFEDRADPDASRLQVASLVPDLDRLMLAGLFPAETGGARSFGFQAGRMPFADVTGYVLNHSLDGLKVTVGREASAFSAGIGTSVLYQLPTSTIVMSNLDVESLSPDPAGSPIEFYNKLAPPRLVATVSYQMRSLFAGQDLTVGAVAQEDLRKEEQLTPEFTETDLRLADLVIVEDDPDTATDETVTIPVPVATGGALDTQYLSLAVSGGIVPGIFHRTYYTLNTGRTLSNRADPDAFDGTSYQYTPILAHMAGSELTWFLPQVLNSRIRLGGMFSTGDADAQRYYEGNTSELATTFVPISASVYSDVFSLQPGNSSHLAISYSLRPLSGIGLDILQTELSSVVYFRTAGVGPVSEGSVGPSPDNLEDVGAYVGTDVDLKVVAQPFSDLRVVLGFGLFAPNATVMTAGNKTVDYQLTLQGVLQF